MRSPDWFVVITELIYMGIPMRQISAKMGNSVTEQLLRAYRAGGEPLYVRGEALIKFWAESTGKHPDNVPRKEFARGHRRTESRKTA